jgi:hypothetical protein
MPLPWPAPDFSESILPGSTGPANHGPTAVAGGPPSIDLALRVVDRKELVGVQSFMPWLVSESRSETVFHRVSRPDEVDLYTASMRPLVKGLGRDLGGIVDRSRNFKPPFQAQWIRVTDFMVSRSLPSTVPAR